MNQQPTYLTLIQSLLNSPRDEQIAILQNNLELIDDNFARYLREWATQTIAEMESEEADKFASNIYSFNITISSFPLGSRAANIEIAIACDEIALTVWNRDDYPEKWAMILNSMGIDYSNRIKFDRGENIEKAIECYLAALEVYTRDALPQQWATTQNNLANAYSDRIKFDRGENIEKAIECYLAALEVYTRDALPQQWATTQNNLANAYSDRIKFDRGENIEKAIECYLAALEVYTRDALPQQWAMTQNNLANAYSDRIKFDRGENIEKAIECYLAALEVRTPITLPLDCLQTGRNLGDLGFAESLWETAIFGYEKAIEAVEQSREWVTSDNRKREIIEENLNVYEKMMQSCINHQQYHKAIQTIERSKSRYLIELFTNSEIYPKTATETEKQQLQNLRRQIAATRQSLETQTPLSPPIVGAVPRVPALFLSHPTHNPNQQPHSRISPTTKRQFRNTITTTKPTTRTNKTARTRIHPNSKSRTHRHHQIPTNPRHQNSDRRMVHRQFQLELQLQLPPS